MPTFPVGLDLGYAGWPTSYRTHSIPGPFNAGVIFERDYDLSPPTDDEIIIATVRVRNGFRRLSVEEGAMLPERPNKRNYISRLSSRISHAPSPGSRDKYTALKMPRREYKRHFARDRNGAYVGTEPEREWDEADLQREFGVYQDMALRSVPGCSEYGEGDGTRRESVKSAKGESAGSESVDGEEGVKRDDLVAKECPAGAVVASPKQEKSDEMWWL